MNKTFVWLGVITMMIGIITMVPHSAFAHKHNDDNNNYSYTSTQYSNDGQVNYNTGYNDGFYTAQTDWNGNVYSSDGNGNPNQGCTEDHSQQYCNGFYAGYSKLWAQWEYNLAHGLNLVNSPSQAQTSAVSTTIKGNDNTVNNIITQSQAANTDSSGGGSNRGDLSMCKVGCVVIR